MTTELDILAERLADAITLREDALTKGHVASWEEYKYLTGVVAGLKGALDAVLELDEKMTDM